MGDMEQLPDWWHANRRANVQTFVAMATWHLEFANPCFNRIAESGIYSTDETAILSYIYQLNNAFVFAWQLYNLRVNLACKGDTNPDIKLGEIILQRLETDG